MKNISSKIIIATAIVATARANAGGELASQFLKSATIDLATDSITLPLHHGHMKDGRSAYYVLTDVDDAKTATALGLTYSPHLYYASTATSTRHAEIDSTGNFIFDRGTVDFSPLRKVVAGDAPNYFPPKTFQPGSVADMNYSPFVVVDGHTYNAPILAFDVSESQIEFSRGKVDYSLVHDKVLSISPKTKQVTLALTHGYSRGNEVVYLSFDANIDLPAALEEATLVPNYDDLKESGATLDLYAVINGELGIQNPNRQGLNSAVKGEGAPFNILDRDPGLTGYSPLWDVNMVVWSDSAVGLAKRHVLKSLFQAFTEARMGNLSGPMGSLISSSGILVNCPVVGRLK